MTRPRNTKSTKKKTHRFQYNCTLFSSRQNTKPHTNQKKQKDFQKKKNTSQKTESKKRKPEANFNQKSDETRSRCCCGEAHWQVRKLKQELAQRDVLHARESHTTRTEKGTF
jgi:hypothetical protein